MKHKLSILMFTFFLVLSFGSFEQVLACSCIRKSPCQKYESANIVFAGKVIDIKSKKKHLFAVTFEISEPFKGLRNQTRFEILSSQYGGGDCSFRYKLNEEYLIYTRKNSNGNYKPNICSIESLKYKTESLSIFRALKNKTKELSIFGKIFDISEEYKKLKALKNLQIKAQEIGKNKKTFFGTSDENGFYNVKVPVGRYLVTPVLPQNFIYGEIISGKSRSIRVRKSSCNYKYFQIINKEDERVQNRRS